MVILANWIFTRQQKMLPEYTKYGSFDFKMQNASSRVVFAQSLKKATKIKFEVHSGLGDFVSCDEMEFYQKNPDKKLDAQLLGVFTDITCTEVRDEATDAQINALPGYFANIAIQLKRNTYDEWEKSFPYTRLSPLQQCRGMGRNTDDQTIQQLRQSYGYLCGSRRFSHCVGKVTPMDRVYLFNASVKKKSGDYVQTAASGETRFLEEGVNKLGFTQRGCCSLCITLTCRMSMQNL